MNVGVMSWFVINPTMGREFPVVNQAVMDLRVVTGVWIRDYDLP